jgi:propionyl-CoA synthetase
MKCAANLLAYRRSANVSRNAFNRLARFSAISSSDPSIQVHKDSLSAPEEYWGRVGNDIVWTKKPEKILESSKAPFYTWYKGGEMNTCYNCVDRHIADGFGDQNAIIFDSPVTSVIRKITYKQLGEQVNTFAGLLVEQGVVKGDRVVIYMPNIPEASVAMLACARIGAIHSVVFGGFAAPELATRIRDSTPKLIICSSCGIDGAKVIEYKPLLDAAIEIASDTHKVEKCIVFQREQKTAAMIPGRDIDWMEGVNAVTAPVKDCVPVAADHPLYILYTSGTTGAPKGVLRDNGGHAVALKWTMDKVYGMKPGEVFWSARLVQRKSMSLF